MSDVPNRGLTYTTNADDEFRRITLIEPVWDGLQALRRAREQPFDLVVLDIDPVAFRGQDSLQHRSQAQVVLDHEDSPATTKS
jgi:CheY-like chemotaxis protein